MSTPPVINVPKFTPKAGLLIVAKVNIPNGRRNISANDVGKIVALNTHTQVATISVVTRGSILTQTYSQLQSNWKVK